jgi:DNA-directed RNA polymerase specialized sigma24 family protein
MARNNFLDQIRKRQEATKEPEPTEAKPTEQMTDDELQQALDKARRDLLDAQHQELREREIARVSGTTTPEPAPSLAGVLREKQRGKRRTWR